MNVNPDSGGELEPAGPPLELGALAEQLVADAAERGVQLTGEGGLLTRLTKQVLQSALEAEMSTHLGYDKREATGRNRGNSRNGTTPKTVTTDVGRVVIDVPRDRDGTFDPAIVPKHQRRLDGFDGQVISLYAKGMTTGDITRHLADVYGTDVSPQAVVQTCVVHLVRNSLRYASKKHWQQITRELKTVYTAKTLAEATDAFAGFAEHWSPTSPAMVEMWRRAWEEFTPFLDFPVEIRTLIYTTSGIESLNARFRAAMRRRGHFPDEQSALKVLYLTCLERRPNRANPTGQISGWKKILNVLAMTYGERITNP